MDFATLLARVFLLFPERLTVFPKVAAQIRDNPVLKLIVRAIVGELVNIEAIKRPLDRALGLLL